MGIASLHWYLVLAFLHMVATPQKLVSSLSGWEGVDYCPFSSCATLDIEDSQLSLGWQDSVNQGDRGWHWRRGSEGAGIGWLLPLSICPTSPHLSDQGADDRRHVLHHSSNEPNDFRAVRAVASLPFLPCPRAKEVSNGMYLLHSQANVRVAAFFASQSPLQRRQVTVGRECCLVAPHKVGLPQR
jgi:hypothetical protein